MALIDKLTAIADAIRVKTGKTATMTLDEMPTEIAAIEAGEGITATASYPNKGEISKDMAAYPFKPKYKNELIIWNITGNNTPNVGSVTPYAYMVWVLNGVPKNADRWIAGDATTAPWASENLQLANRTGSFYLDDDGYLTLTTGLWGWTGNGNTVTIYEIPLGNGDLSETTEETEPEEADAAEVT